MEAAYNHTMLRTRRRNAILILALAGLFYFFFMFTKHDPALSAVNPFAVDPFDAVGSFGIQAAGLLALLSLARNFWPFGTFPLGQSDVLDVRAQLAAVLAVLVTLAGDVVAMARSQALWLHSPAGGKLCLLVAGMLLLASAICWVILRSSRETATAALAGSRTRALAICMGIASILFLYPEALRRGIGGALFTVVVGALALFLPMRVLVVALVPCSGPESSERPENIGHGWRRRLQCQRLAILALGIVLGLAFVVAEFAEGGGLPRLSKLAFVGSVYVGLEAVGLLTGYEFLKTPLRLFQGKS
jgi:hypothetical protein